MRWMTWRAMCGGPLVAAAFADDPAALAAIADMGASTAMFQGMVPPLAAAIHRLEAGPAHSSPAHLTCQPSHLWWFYP